MIFLAGGPAPIPSLPATPSPLPQDLWWAGYHAGFTTATWLAIFIVGTAVCAALLAYRAGRKAWLFDAFRPLAKESKTKVGL